MEETYFAINEAQQLELETDETGVLDLMDQICRLCARWTDNLVHLFSEPAVQKGLVEMINLHLPLEVKVCDVLPLHICNSCIKKVEVCHELIQTSLTSQTQLLELFAPLMDTKLPEASTCSINDKTLLNNSNVLVPECAKMVENNPTMNETEIFTKKIAPPFNNSTVMEEKAIHLFSPSDSKNSVMDNCDQQTDEVENLIECEPTASPNKCQPCDLVFDDIDCLTTHQIAVHSTNVFCCWDCNILFGTEIEYEAHTVLHDGISADDATFEALALSVTEDAAGTAPEVHSVEAKRNKQQCVKNTLFLNKEKEELGETIIPFPGSELEEVGTKINAGIDNLLIISGAATSENFSGTDQLEEGNPSGIDISKDFFKNNVIRKIKVEIPLKDFFMKKPSEEQRISNYAESMPMPARKARKKRKFPCNYCTNMYATKYRLVKHENLHTHEYTFTCNACDKLFYTKDSLTIHLYTHNDEMKPLACEYDGCTKRFTSKTLLLAHAQSHSDKRHFICEICHAAFKQMKGLIRHNETQHLEALHQCTVCSKEYKSSHLLADHMRSHSAARMYKCDECGMAFAQANRRNLHKAVHTNERKHKCHLCTSTFKRASHLSAHVKRHGRTHAYKCTACGLPFDSLREVSAHRKTHTVTELNATRRRTPARSSLGAEFQCPVCDKLLLTKVTLQNHLALHTDVKPYQCDLCDQSFTTESHMTNHRVIHSGMKPFPCQYCPEGFMYKEEREMHERTHTVVNPYVCEFCDGEFTSKMSLNQHLAVHADVRRHACDFCGQRFRRRDTLDAHIRTHTGERPFACSFCTQSFKQKGDCIMHERKSHKDQVHINSAVASISSESSIGYH